MVGEKICKMLNTYKERFCGKGNWFPGRNNHLDCTEEKFELNDS